MQQTAKLTGTCLRFCPSMWGKILGMVSLATHLVPCTELWAEWNLYIYWSRLENPWSGLVCCQYWLEVVIRCVWVSLYADEKTRSLAEGMISRSTWKTGQRAEDSHKIYGRAFGWGQIPRDRKLFRSHWADGVDLGSCKEWWIYLNMVQISRIEHSSRLNISRAHEGSSWAWSKSMRLDLGGKRWCYMSEWNSHGWYCGWDIASRSQIFSKGILCLRLTLAIWAGPDLYPYGILHYFPHYANTVAECSSTLLVLELAQVYLHYTLSDPRDILGSTFPCKHSFSRCPNLSFPNVWVLIRTA
jgi:hypothetical protein